MRGGQEAPWGSAQIVGLFVAGAALLAAFAVWERRTEQPIVPVELFRTRVFTAANLAGFATGVGMFGTIMFVPLFVQGVLGGSATSSGLVLTPLMLAMMVASVGSGHDHHEDRALPVGAARRPGRDGRGLRAAQHARRRLLARRHDRRR